MPSSVRRGSLHRYILHLASSYTGLGLRRLGNNDFFENAFNGADIDPTSDFFRKGHDTSQKGTICLDNWTREKSTLWNALVRSYKKEKTGVIEKNGRMSKTRNEPCSTGIERKDVTMS